MKSDKATNEKIVSAIMKLLPKTPQLTTLSDRQASRSLREAHRQEGASEGLQLSKVHEMLVETG